MKILALLLCYYACSELPARAAASPSIRLSVRQTEVVRGFPVIVQLNISSEYPLTVDLGRDRTGGIRFNAITPTGSRAIALLKHQGITRIGTFEVDPAHPYQQLLVLPASEFSAHEPLLILGVVEALTGKSEKTQVDVRLMVRFQAYSEEAMKLSCAQLVSDIVHSNAASERIEMALALSTVRDPAALPYTLSLIGKGWGVDSLLISGIEHMGTVDAITALGDISAATSSDVSGTATAALLRIRSNPSLSQEVREKAEDVMRTESRQRPSLLQPQ